jgi:hypothetical protein
MQATIEANELVIRLPLEEPRPSSSGKTLIVASTRGNQESTARIGDKPIVVSVNAYIYAKAKRPSDPIIRAELAEGGAA